jgi:O-antigen/teichoic acid export membrane protein
MSRQIGEFFLFIGIVLLVIFFASDQSENTAWGYFIGGAALTALGGYLMWRNRRPDLESGRFKSYRRMRDRPKKVKKKIREEE